MKKQHNKFKEEIDDSYERELELLYQTEAEDFIKSIDVAGALEGVDVDVNERKIIWADGKRLTINQSAKIIQEQTGIELTFIKYSIIAWLLIEFVPKGLNEKQMGVFEAEVSNWIKDYESGVSES